MAAELLILAGLPGCGKTAYIKGLREEGWSDFDDFKSGAIDNSPAFGKSRKFEALLAHLREGRRCVVADIDFCKGVSRAEAESVLKGEVPDVKVQWLFFANDEPACEVNIRRRNRQSLEADLGKLQEYSPVYEIPSGVNVRPVLVGQT